MRELWNRKDVPANMLLCVAVLWAGMVGWLGLAPTLVTAPAVALLFFDQWRFARRLDDVA